MENGGWIDDEFQLAGECRHVDAEPPAERHLPNREGLRKTLNTARNCEFLIHDVFAAFEPF